MPDVSTIRERYGARFALLEPLDAAAVESVGDGGGLVAAVESRGVTRLARSLAQGDRLRLEDDGVTLELQRESHQATVRVSWTDGPAYEERIPLATNDGGTRRETTASAPVVHLQADGTLAVQLDPASRVDDLTAALHDPALPLLVTPSGAYTRAGEGPAEPLRVRVPSVDPGELGAASFRETHGVRACYIAGAMAGGIASPEIVLAMARAGLIGFYGAGGVPLERVDADVARIQAGVAELRAAGQGAAAGCNLLHNPVEPGVEDATVDLYLRHGVTHISASAYMRLTSAVVRFRTAGIHQASDGSVVCPHKVFAKVSREEVAERFMRPAPASILDGLVADGHLTAKQARLAATVPVAEDVTAEADSGGHTDQRPLVVLLPLLQRLRDRITAEEDYASRGIVLRVGVAGGLGDPSSVHGAFSLGADYVLTGSINQATVEAGTSPLAKSLVADVGMADVKMAPAPDMFEIGARVQVVSRGSLYPQRAAKLYDLYKRYDKLEAIPKRARAQLEKSVFGMDIDEVWSLTRAYWTSRDPREVAKAEEKPKHKMALTFRWYLGNASRWARTGDADRKRDFQIWCGPSMGLFNAWVKGTWLEPLDARRVVVVADALLHGAAVLQRVHMARAAGVAVPSAAFHPLPVQIG